LRALQFVSPAHLRELAAAKGRQELAPPTRDGEMNRVNITLRQKVQSRRAA
jgi:hypothetical protein